MTTMLRSPAIVRKKKMGREMRTCRRLPCANGMDDPDASVTARSDRAEGIEQLPRKKN
jgi:hypothetical protein